MVGVGRQQLLALEAGPKPIAQQVHLLPAKRAHGAHDLHQLPLTQRHLGRGRTVVQRHQEPPAQRATAEGKGPAAPKADDLAVHRHDAIAEQPRLGEDLIDPQPGRNRLGLSTGLARRQAKEHEQAGYHDALYR